MTLYILLCFQRSSALTALVPSYNQSRALQSHLLYERDSSLTTSDHVIEFKVNLPISPNMAEVIRQCNETHRDQNKHIFEENMHFLLPKTCKKNKHVPTQNTYTCVCVHTRVHAQTLSLSLCLFMMLHSHVF